MHKPRNHNSKIYLINSVDPRFGADDQPCFFKGNRPTIPAGHPKAGELADATIIYAKNYRSLQGQQQNNQMIRKTSNITDYPNINDQMVEVPSGYIELRDDRKKEKWTVDIAPFLLSKYPVTQDFYFEFTNERPGTFKGDRLPVETVTWKDAVNFCNKLSILTGLVQCYLIQEENEEISFDKTANGFRMPTEAEWEYACKAGTKGIRYEELDLIAWYRGNSKNRTQAVGQKIPNAWGLYDMLGNVWEWCSDIYDTEVYGSYRVFRGGGWCDEERSVMATNRRRSHPLKFKIDDLGFRIARNK